MDRPGTADPKYSRYIKDWVDYFVQPDCSIEQLLDHPKTQSGGYWHKKIYTCQMWPDGIIMGSILMVQYSCEFGAPKWFDLAVNRAVMAYDKTLHKPCNA